MSRRMMRALAPLLAGAMLWAAPAQAQFSESYRFLEAVKKKDGQAVTDALAEPGSTLVNTRDITTGESALHIVVARRDKTWLEFLIARGARVDVRDVKGVTPLVLACNLNFIEGVELLVEKGARLEDANSAGETPLIAAVHSRNIELLRVLLKAGADPDRPDNSGRSAREYARLEGKGSPLLGEIERGAKPKGAKAAKPVYGPS